MVALIDSYSSPSVRSARGKAISPLQLHQMQSQPRPKKVAHLKGTRQDSEAWVIATIRAHDAGEESESDDESEPSRGKGKGLAPICETSANGEGTLLEEDFRELSVAQGNRESDGERDGERDRESDGERDGVSDGEREREGVSDGEREGACDGERDGEGAGERDGARDGERVGEGDDDKKEVKKKIPLTIAVRKAAHLRQAELCHYTLRCKCPLAKANQLESCVDAFSRKSFIALHHEYYGSAVRSVDTPRTGSRKKPKAKLGQASSQFLGNCLHQEMWANKKPLPPGAATLGRKYHVVSWAIEGTPVCRAAWKAARGGSRRQHRDLSKRTHLRPLFAFGL